MASTYEKIATTTLGSTTTAVTFSSISSAYTDIVLVVNGIMSTGENALGIRFNTDAGANYGTTAIYGDSANAQSLRFSNITECYVGRMDSLNNSTTIIQIQNYSNATTYKTTLSRGASANIIMAQAGLWRNTAAITTISIRGFGLFADFLTGTTLNLYGIKAA